MKNMFRVLVCGLISCVSLQTVSSLFVRDLDIVAFNNAVQDRDLDKMADLLYLNKPIPYSLNKDSFENAYKLLWAYKDGNDSEVERLLDLNVSPNALDENYFTILHVACINNDIEMVERLVSKGMLNLFAIIGDLCLDNDSNSKNVIIRKNALYQSAPVLLGTGNGAKTAFFCACESNSIDILKIFLNIFETRLYARYFFIGEKIELNFSSFSQEVQNFLTKELGL